MSDDPKVISEEAVEAAASLVNRSGDDEGNLPWKAVEDFNTGTVNLITDADGTTLASTWASDEPALTARIIVAAVNALPDLLVERDLYREALKRIERAQTEAGPDWPYIVMSIARAALSAHQEEKRRVSEPAVERCARPGCGHWPGSHTINGCLWHEGHQHCTCTRFVASAHQEAPNG